ncbi:hypothetical protein N7471_000771 [Penicillium samsonianum]|uniref:uncharacterized protein n=1 Tax=Penicillium samsonianum TaxID=1882272 RepID=UPI0025468DC7|nr:uncharacterized protein N7471_000771 [Penicillium samsonianum]KAJ6149572.1 hypothetical protein N7471_000771 [Penicillium samsonianum]
MDCIVRLAELGGFNPLDLTSNTVPREHVLCSAVTVVYMHLPILPCDSVFPGAIGLSDSHWGTRCTLLNIFNVDLASVDSVSGVSFEPDNITWPGETPFHSSG